MPTKTTFTGTCSLKSAVREPGCRCWKGAAEAVEHRAARAAAVRVTTSLLLILSPFGSRELAPVGTAEPYFRHGRQVNDLSAWIGRPALLARVPTASAPGA